MPIDVPGGLIALTEKLDSQTFPMHEKLPSGLARARAVRTILVDSAGVGTVFERDADMSSSRSYETGQEMLAARQLFPR